MTLIILLTSEIRMQVCHNDQSLKHLNSLKRAQTQVYRYNPKDENRQRNVGGNRVIRAASSYQRSGLLPRCWLREVYRSTIL